MALVQLAITVAEAVAAAVAVAVESKTKVRMLDNKVEVEFNNKVEVEFNNKVEVGLWCQCPQPPCTITRRANPDTNPSHRHYANEAKDQQFTSKSFTIPSNGASSPPAPTTREAVTLLVMTQFDSSTWDVVVAATLASG